MRIQIIKDENAIVDIETALELKAEHETLLKQFNDSKVLKYTIIFNDNVTLLDMSDLGDIIPEMVKEQIITIK